MADSGPNRATMRPRPALLRDPARWPRAALSGLVQAYRLLLSPWLGSQCRFEPSCSRYALQALESHGAAAGAYLAAARILRCHPGCAGGCDAVPVARPALFRHLFAGATILAPVPDPCVGDTPVAQAADDTSVSSAAAPPVAMTSSRPLS